MGNLNKRVDNIENALKPAGDNFGFLQNLTDDELDAFIQSIMKETSAEEFEVELEEAANDLGMPYEELRRICEQIKADKQGEYNEHRKQGDEVGRSDRG